ncbi:MAG TPA: hypothetical protein PKY82_26325, partial [Pyrinomonadaceae bacterium]|nr:hypothetical protein [Pyrinomonadaceae bacterium]
GICSFIEELRQNIFKKLHRIQQFGWEINNFAHILRKTKTPVLSFEKALDRSLNQLKSYSFEYFKRPEEEGLKF